MEQEFEIGQEVIYIGSTLSGFHGRSCIVTYLRENENPDEPALPTVLFSGVPPFYYRCHAGDLRHIVNWDKEINPSPIVGGLVIHGNASSGQCIEFNAKLPALTEAYDTLHLKEWGASYYRHIVHVIYTSNVTFVTVTIDPHHRVSEITYPLRCFGGTALCNGFDRFDALIGLRTAFRDAMGVGDRSRWDPAKPRVKIQREEWRVLRIALKHIKVDDDTLTLYQSFHSADGTISQG